jgi:hypothetical protein
MRSTIFRILPFAFRQAANAIRGAAARSEEESLKFG